MKILDTVAAISTPRGKGGVAVIRISGTDAVEIGDRVFKAMSGKKISESEPRKALYGQVISACGEIVDDAVAVFFKAPASFTGEDTLEISCHGGVLVTERVLATVFAAGAVQATAGEFTRRAYINGKISLSKAEGLGALLEAKTEEQARLFGGAMRGNLEARAESIRGRLIEVLSSIYAVTDFPEEDLAEMSEAEIVLALEDIYSELDGVCKTYITGKAIAEGVRTVICGSANAGKSTLYNRIVGRDAAIVTDIAGTTRDILEETVSFGGITLRLCDTAGLRKTDDVIESIGISKTEQALDGAELVFAVFDGSAEPSFADEELVSKLERTGQMQISVAVLNKSDKGICESAKKLGERFLRCIEISADYGQGMELLEKAVGELFGNGELDLSNDAIVMNARQRSALERALQSVKTALKAIGAGLSSDMFGLDIENAVSAIGEIDGRTIGEEIVAEIFSKFCVGK